MGILDFIFPKRCLNCGKIGKYFCDQCRLNIKFIATNEAICPVCQKLAIDGATHLHCQTRYTPDGLTSFFRYEGVVKKAVKAIKYRFISDLAQQFVDLIPGDMPTLSFRPPSRNLLVLINGSRVPPLQRAGKPGMTDKSLILIPIPLHSSRFRERGFNQAEVLGKLIARRLNVSMRTDLLKRIKKTIPQVQMKDRRKRLENMQNVFSLNNIPVKQCNNVILFDDVFTTGATMRSAANILKRAGIKRVWAVTMAR